MVNTHNNNITRLCFYSLWLTVCVLQAYSTGLLADEAYYWKYAQHLSWGYFDHPPVIAAIIKPGYTLLQNELGVRLFPVLMGTAFIYLLELLTQPKRLLLFYLTIVSIGAFHFLSFLALPDMPLLFFTALFLYLYRIYIDKDSWPIALLLAVTTTLLLLSKYHGVLVIGFVMLANPRLLLRISFWGIAVLSAAMFMPHAWWQITHDFPSINYHLSERSTGGYKIDNTLNYILSALLVFSPVAGIVLAGHTIKARPGNIFDRTLKLLLAGTLLFFLAMTIKGRAEANWVAIALVPAIVYGYRLVEDKSWFPKFIRTAAIASLLLILPLRSYLMYDFLPDSPQLAYTKETLHHTKKWASQLQEKAGERPVVFMNKYQYAAWYEFYTGYRSISLNNRMGRKNQYNIWNDEFEIQGKDIMLVPNYYIPTLDSIATAKGLFQYQYIDNFRSASQLVITPTLEQVKVQLGEITTIHFTVYTKNDNWTMGSNPQLPAVIHAIIFKENKFYSDNSLEVYINAEFEMDMSYQHSVKIKAPAEAGTYELYLDITVGPLPPAINGKKITMTVY